jgi:hypothetical protein
MNFKSWLLTEMPITKFQLAGDWSDNAPTRKFKRADIGILTSLKGVEKIHKKWSNTKDNFELYFVRSKDASKYEQIGEVDLQWVKDNLGLHLAPSEDAITVIFTGNVGGTNAMPMSAWIIAHRVGQALMGRKTTHEVFAEHFVENVKRDFRDILECIYNRKYDVENTRDYSARNRMEQKIQDDIILLAQSVATMRSAREKKINTFYEFCYELVAQYVITGHVKFNPLPKEVFTGRLWGKERYKASSGITEQDMDGWNQRLKTMSRDYEYYLDQTFGSMIGKIFVM